MTTTVPAPDATGDVLRWVQGLTRLSDEVNRVDDIGSFLDRAALICAELSGCDFALVRIDRPEPLVGHFGLTPEYYALFTHDSSLQQKPGQWSAVYEALETGRPVVVPDFHADPRLAWWLVNADRAGIRSYASFPLVSQAGLLGVLNIYYRDVHDYTEVEVGAVRALAGYTAIAIETATLRREREEQFEVLRTSLERRAVVDQLHRAVTSVALGRTGAAGTLRALAEVLGASSVFEDTSGRILATASADGSRSDIRWIIESAVRRERASAVVESAVLVADGPSHRERLYRSPVVVESKSVGTLWMLVGGHVDDELARQGSEYAAVTLALDLSGRAIEEENRGRVFDDLVAELFAAETDEQSALAQEKAVRLGHELIAPLGLAIGGDPSGTGGLEHARAIVSRLRRRAESRPGGPLVSRRGSLLVVVWSAARTTGPLADGTQATSVDGIVTALAEATGRPVVVCSPSPDIAGLRDSWGTGSKLLQLAHRSSERGLPTGETRSGRIVDARRTGLAGLLLESSDPERLLAFRDATLGDLLAYDREHRTDLLETLEVAIAQGFGVKESARVLMVHPNTLVYRLRRVGEILGIDVHAADDRLALELALAVTRML